MLRPLFFRLLLCLQTCSVVCTMPLFSQTVKSNINGQALPTLNKSNNNTSNNKPSLISKPVIDTTAIFNWPRLSNDCSISPEGSFTMYKIFNYPRGKTTLVVQSTGDTSWKKQVLNANAICFSSDENQAVYSRADSLFFLSLRAGEVKSITGVQSYRQPRVERGTWLAYQLKEEAKELVLLNMVTGQEQRFSSVEDYSFSDNGKTMLLKQSDQSITSLQWVSLESKKAVIIWTAQAGMELSGYNFDLQGEQLVLMTRTTTGNTIWYYKEGMDKAVEKISNTTEGIAAGFQISGDIPFFNKGGKYIFFKLQKPVKQPKQDPNAVAVDVWSYKDVRLIPEQSKQIIPKSFTSVIATDANKVVQVEQEGEGIMTSGGQNIEKNFAGDALIVSKKNGTDFWWNWNKPRPYYVVSLQDGSRQLLINGKIHEFLYSLTGKYIIYFDPLVRNYMCYETATQLLRNVTKDIHESLIDEYKLYVPGRTFPIAVGVAGWFEDDAALLIYDNYDIWRIDLKNSHSPINITAGYGKKHLIKFKIVYEKDAYYRDMIRKEGETLLLTGFNTKTKYNGFYEKPLKINGDHPDKLTMGPYLFYRYNSQVPSDDAFDVSGGMKPIEANNRPLWLIKQQSSTDAPNYSLTGDFKTYKRLTDIQPQKAYNWFTSELVNYKQLDGTMSQGILYKPENFDSSKKYPVLFSYYETFSYRVYEYPRPGLVTARIDIPWYVSQGYLVFTPDIHYSIANLTGKVAGDHAVNSIVGAAQHLAKLSYVDSKKMGIQGHSFAGYETNYLITHTNIFAAACEMAGTSNVISAYLALITPNGKVQGDKQVGYETGQGRLGTTLWQRPDLYIKYSPVFKASSVTTPLLIVHNHGDGAIDWQNGVQMYMALRRLQKPVWMLQYDGEDHVMEDNKKALDFTIRMNQFFDHYLKEKPQPLWMAVGVPSALKGIESRLYNSLENSKK